VGDWMERLQNEGVRGADLVFACIGPALEIYSRYSKVEDAEGKPIPLGGDPEAKEPHKRGYLAYVWETVGRIALQNILGTDDLPAASRDAAQAGARARNGAAGALEEDARLTALFLWTLQSTNGEESHRRDAENAEEEEVENDEDSASSAPPRCKGFSLVFDVARRFAQPLGIHLPDWEGRIIETQKGVVRLLSVSERARQLFGDDGADAVADLIEHDPRRDYQQLLFPELEDNPPQRRKGRRGKTKRLFNEESLRSPRLGGEKEATTLDRVHAAMLLQAGGQANALRMLIKAEQDRGPDFLRLANALSALYPKNSEEKRLLDAMLLAVPR
ncbi:MAG: DNA methyltransferase, partial [Nitrospirae bacterium CG08_land_8_20_14_0_20_52_24]